MHPTRQLGDGRQEILDRVLRVLVVVSLIPAVTGTMLALKTGVYPIAVVDPLGWLCVLAMSRVRGHFVVRGTLLVAVLLVVGTVVLYSVGPRGVGLVWMVAAPALGGVLFGRRGLIGAALGLFAALAMVYGLVSLGLQGESWRDAEQLELWWILAIASTLAVAVVTTLPSVQLVSWLRDSLEEEARNLRRLAERSADVRRLQAEFELLFSLTPQALILTTRAGRIRLHNQAASELLGVKKGDAIASFLDVPGSCVVGSLVHARRANGESFFTEVTSRRCVLDGVEYVLLGCVDVDARELSARALTRALDERDTLLREVHHRVKNNLQITSSLLDLQSGNMRTEEARIALRESVLRIRSMSLVHQQLYAGDSFSQVRFDVYIQELVRGVVTAIDPKVQLRFDLSPIALDLSVALPCGMIANELLTNAVKHGRGTDGTVRVDVRVAEEDGSLQLEVRDHGPGVGDQWEASSSALGSRILRALVRQVRGTLQTEDQPGAVFTLRVPTTAPVDVPIPARRGSEAGR